MTHLRAECLAVHGFYPRVACLYFDGSNSETSGSLLFVTLNVKKILAVINATYAVAKRKPEKLRLAGIRTLTSAIPVQCSN